MILYFRIYIVLPKYISQSFKHIGGSTSITVNYICKQSVHAAGGNNHITLSHSAETEVLLQIVKCNRWMSGVSVSGR